MVHFTRCFEHQETTHFSRSPAWWLKPRQKWEDISAFNGSCAVKPLKMTQERHSSRYAWKRGEDRIKGRQGQDGGLSLCMFLINILCFCATWKQCLFKNQVGKTSLMVLPGGPLPPGRFPWWQVDRNPPTSAGDMGSIPGPRRSHVPRSSYACAPRLLKPADRNPRAPLQEKTPQRETRASQLQSRLRWPQLEKARRKQWRPSAAKNKYK